MKGDGEKLLGLVVLETVGNNAQGQSLHLLNGLFFGCAVCHHAGKVGNLSDPPAVAFNFCLDFKLHR